MPRLCRVIFLILSGAGSACGVRVGSQARASLDCFVPIDDLLQLGSISFVLLQIESLWQAGRMGFEIFCEKLLEIGRQAIIHPR